MLVDEVRKSAVASAAVLLRGIAAGSVDGDQARLCAPRRPRTEGEVELDGVPRNADQAYRGRRPIRRPGAPYSEAVSTHASDDSEAGDLELPVEDLLRRARPLPPHDEMVIEDLTEEEGVAFLEAIKS
jgi:hypothetical protein